LLLIEDNPARARTIQGWIPEGVRCVLVTSAGRALGLIKRDAGRVYGGILLDHDLQEQTVAQDEYLLSGSDLLDHIIRHVSKDVPILIHSMNMLQGPSMARKLEAAGFSVTRIPMSDLTEEAFSEWLGYAIELWKDFEE